MRLIFHKRKGSAFNLKFKLCQEYYSTKTFSQLEIPIFMVQIWVSPQKMYFVKLSYNFEMYAIGLHDVCSTIEFGNVSF